MMATVNHPGTAELNQFRGGKRRHYRPVSARPRYRAERRVERLELEAHLLNARLAQVERDRGADHVAKLLRTSPSKAQAMLDTGIPLNTLVFQAQCSLLPRPDGPAQRRRDRAPVLLGDILLDLETDEDKVPGWRQLALASFDAARSLNKMRAGTTALGRAISWRGRAG